MSEHSDADRPPAKPPAPGLERPPTFAARSTDALASPDALAAFYQITERYRDQNELADVFENLGIAPELAAAKVPLSRLHENLHNDISSLRGEVSRLQLEVLAATRRSGQSEREVDRLRETLQELRVKEQLNFILTRISVEAGRVLLESEALRHKFLQQTACEAFVMSVDIRRSTELMLKARSPQLYARFITELCCRLREAILAQHGVFDKFTGDGILAFFPDFFTGEDAGYYALCAAETCHRLFAEHYAKSRPCFLTVLKDVGLGIGLDFGTTHLVQIGDGLTVVGTPVVYACRMSGAKAGTTLANQPCYERLLERYGPYCLFTETDLNAKHEGSHVAYAVSLGDEPYQPQSPAWPRHQSTSA